MIDLAQNGVPHTSRCPGSVPHTFVYCALLKKTAACRLLRDMTYESPANGWDASLMSCAASATENGDLCTLASVLNSGAATGPVQCDLAMWADW